MNRIKIAKIYSFGIIIVGFFLIFSTPATACVVDIQEPVFSGGGVVGFLAGIVTDVDTSLPIEGATVSVNTGSSAITLQDGSYLISDVTPGYYLVTTDAAGYSQCTSTEALVEGGYLTIANFQLSPVLKLKAVYPTLGLRGPNDLGVTLKGTGFNTNTRVSMYLDSGNRQSIVGSVQVPNYALNVTVSGSYAYVAGGESGLLVIDISTASTPQLVSSEATPGFARGVAVSGSYAYVTDDAEGFQVMDISTPSAPQLVASVVTPGTYSPGVTVSGSYAYVADYDSGLQIVDISTPSTPNLIGSEDTPSHAYAVAVSGNYAYVADFDSGLQIIDISTPSDPQIIGTGVDTPGPATGVTVSGSYAYVSAYYNGLQVIDISTPSAPEIIGSVDTPDVASSVTVSGNYAYVADRQGGLHVIDISTPSDPKLIASVDTPAYANGVAVLGSYAFVADSWSLQVIDISSLQNTHQLVGSVEMPRSVVGVELSGNYAYLLSSGQGGFQIIDISTPSNPQSIGSVSISLYAMDVTVSGNYAYVSAWTNGLQVIDISSPSNPQLIGFESTPYRPKSAAVSGDYLYVADGSSGLQVMDISTPSDPQLIITGGTPQYAEDVAVSGSYAYVVGGAFSGSSDGGLEVVDISTPSSPQVVGSVDTPSIAYGIAVSGSYAYVADFDSSFQVIDISTPSSPQIVGSLNTPGHAYDVTVSGNYAYVADGGGGLQMIDISAPSNPILIGSVDTLDHAGDVAVSGSYAYVADGSTGLVIVPVPVEIASVFVTSNTELSAFLPSPVMAGSYTLKAFNSSQSHELPGAVSFTDDPDLLNSKAIIVAGGGPDATGGVIWEETKRCANKAYDALILQGYEHGSIYYVSMEAGNAYVNSSNPATMFSDLSYAINVWAADATQVLLYFVDHGQTEQFVLFADADSTQTLSAQELDGWLDNLQSTMTGPVTFVYDACNSGSFISKMRPPDGRERIIITGSSYEPAYFLENGENSFSFQFWDKTILNKGNLGNAFSFARDTMQSYQNAIVEANWDFEGNTNETSDIDIANDRVIRRGTYVYVGVHPYIVSVSEPKVLSVGTSATLWAKGVIDAETVWAQIIPPDVNPADPNLPITDLPSIPLTYSEADDLYTGVYDGFAVDGTYIIVIKAKITQEIYSYVQGSSSVQTIYSAPRYTSVTKTSGVSAIEPDSHEEDDAYSQANVIVVNAYTPQSHNFHDVGDLDWVKFYGLSSEIYKIKAYSLGVFCDGIIEVYDSDGSTLLAGPKNDAGPGEDEYVEWTCPQDGVYYVKISNANSNFGENVKYELKVYRPIGGEPGNLIGRVTDSLNNGIGNATLKTSLGSTISFPNGYYWLVLPSGTHSVTVTANGYSPGQDDVTIQSGNDTPKDFELTSDPDTDEDGIPDSIDPDDDNDGMPDDWEILYSLNPLFDDSAAHADSDTYTNLQEYLAGSDPTNGSSYPQTTIVNLKKGFNLVAIPAEVSVQSDLRDWVPVIGDISQIEKVMAYDAQAEKYAMLIPGEPSNPSVILQGDEGLIVYAKQDQEVSFTSVLCSGADLNQGFNLIGIACPPENYTAFQLLTALGSSNVTSIQRYSTDNGMFETAGYDQSSNPSGVDFPIIAGEGYFIYMKQAVLDFSF